MLNVNPTRMELLKLKKRLVVAKRGHKLLKDKQDELMRKFLSAVRELKTLREQVEKELIEAYKDMLTVRLNMSEAELEEALSVTSAKLTLETKYISLFNLKIPKYQVHVEGNIFSYSYISTPPAMDKALKQLYNVVKRLLELAELENIVKQLAIEIEKTKRRVNALEYKLIPEIEETIKYITNKLSEMERSDKSRIMRIKEIVRQH